MPTVVISPKEPTVRPAAALMLVLLLSACASGAESPSSQASGASDAVTEETHEDEEVTAYGAPAVGAEDADRVVDIEQNEDPGMVFSPDTVDVATGETVTFRITNVGQLRHEFTLGDEPTQEAHEEEMAAMGGADGGMSMHDEPNAIAVEPGETKELTWTFTEPGEVLYGCHEPGHYAAGMVGTLTVA